MRARLTSLGPNLRSSHPRRLALIVALAIVAAIALPGATAGATANTGAAGFAGRYVALGDSYAAGPGVPRLRITSGLCGRSTNNYPTRVAAELAPSAFTDVSCSGAETHHMTTRQHSNPPQYSALKADTRVVTITIGGNDADFFKIFVLASLSRLPACWAASSAPFHWDPESEPVGPRRSVSREEP